MPGNVMVEVKALVMRIFKERTFLATVVSDDGTKITIVRDGQTVAEGPYAAHYGVAALVAPGDRVTVQDFADQGYVVTGKVV